MKHLILLTALAFVSCKDVEPIPDSPESTPPPTPQLKDQAPSPKPTAPTPKTTTPERLIPPPTPPVGGKPVPVPTPNTDTPPAPTPISKYKTAVAIPGKPGFVFNPWTNLEVDVRGVPPGSLVRDPKDANTDHKFRIP